MEFKQSGALMPYQHALETGDLSIAQAMWSSSDTSIVSDGNPTWFSMQFFAGVRYFNGSGNGLLHIPVDCSGGWACDPLVDWPTNTRDGYVIPNNTDDAIRSSLGAIAIDGLSVTANWLGESAAAARYASMAQAIREGILRTLLRLNNTGSGGGEAYFVDGASGAGADHAAVHSTIYAIAAGVVDEQPELAGPLARYLTRLDTHGSSCMTGRWVVEAAFRLGIYDEAGAAYGLDLLSRSTYPSWGNMITEWNATTAMEAWQPADKWNMDWAHPWCASPAFTIPRWLLGVQPLELGWTRFRIAPQPVNLTSVIATLPTPLGSVVVSLVVLNGIAIEVQYSVPAGSTALLCLPPTGPGNHTSDLLSIDGTVVASTAWGRMLCTVNDTATGSHSARRQAA